MTHFEIRNSEDARRVLLQSLLWQRVLPPDPTRLASIFAWALELTAFGETLLPLGMIADIGHLTLAVEAENKPSAPPAYQTLLPGPLLRTYEDYVLGRLYADSSFERGSTAVCRYEGDRDRGKGVAFLIDQFARRASLGGLRFSPALLKSLSLEPPETLLTEAELSLRETGLPDELRSLYESISLAVRNTGDALGPEDVFELEHGTALAEFGQRLALRQVLKAAADLTAEVPAQPIHSLPRHEQIATNILDEDTYPVGGFTSISTRGTVESLLHSQLAYMERDERPDLFDLKFLRDELLYYSRDENTFLRRRRTFLIALDPSLASTRVKDSGATYQRIVHLLGALTVLVRVLTNWLDADALRFEFLFLTGDEGRTGADSTSPLEDEADLLRMIFREPIAHDVVHVRDLPAGELDEFATARSRDSLCHLLRVGTSEASADIEGVYVSQVGIGGPVPHVALDDETPEPVESDSPEEVWSKTLFWLLGAWLAGAET